MNLHWFVTIHGGIHTFTRATHQVVVNHQRKVIYDIYMPNALLEYSTHASANSPEKSRSPNAIIITMPISTRLNCVSHPISLEDGRKIPPY